MSGLPLAPQPDPDSGEPRPPPAPTVAGPWAGHRRRGRRTDSWRPAWVVNWFNSPDPSLELAEAKRRHGLRSVGLYSAGLLIWLYLLGAWELWGSQIHDEQDEIVFAAIFGGLWALWTTALYVVMRKQTIYVGAC